jgi:hypothetical protein
MGQKRYELGTREVRDFPTDYCDRIRFRVGLPTSFSFGSRFSVFGVPFDVTGRRRRNSCDIELNFESGEDPGRAVKMVSEGIKTLPRGVHGNLVRDSFIEAFLSAYKENPMGLHLDEEKNVELPAETMQVRAYSRDLNTLGEFFGRLDQRRLLEGVVDR